MLKSGKSGIKRQNKCIYIYVYRVWEEGGREKGEGRESVREKENERERRDHLSKPIYVHCTVYTCDFVLWNDWCGAHDTYSSLVHP